MTSTHDPDYQAFIERLKKARIEAGLTQVQVAENLGEHQSFVAKCESGERRIDVIELGRFAEIYGKPLTYFVGESNR